MKKLLFSVTIKDCIVQTFTAGGPGGQHQNRSQTGVRITHPPSGAVSECRETRSQKTNKQRAFRRMAESEKFRVWQKITAARLSGQPTPDEWIEQQMHPSNLKIEVRQGGQWKEI